MEILLDGLSQTNVFGRALAEAIEDRAIIALTGTLGAGKTTLVKALGQGLGVSEVISSPTFTMLNEYHSGRLSLFHLDLYRGGETGEQFDLSMLAMELDEVIDQKSVVIMEWPEYFVVDGENYLADKDRLEISLRHVKQEDLLQHAMAQTEGEGAKVLRETLQSLNPIKDGNSEGRIANLVARGQQSSRLIGRLQSAVTDMVIYL
jgi:tRNA threonylcarbamoyladenosine biosynthesis protein TsaE